jgi:hypothetical protein
VYHFRPLARDGNRIPAPGTTWWLYAELDHGDGSFINGAIRRKVEPSRRIRILTTQVLL